ncbi:MAG: hypothetical protein ABSA18_01875 [Dehalococcoidia bacterium]
MVKDSEVSLEYTFPMVKTGEQRENLGVLSTVQEWWAILDLNQ